MGQRMSPETSTKIGNMLRNGNYTTEEICVACKVVPSQVYNQKLRLKKAEEGKKHPVPAEEVEVSEQSDSDYWHEKYMWALSLLIRHSIVEVTEAE